MEPTNLMEQSVQPILQSIRELTDFYQKYGHLYVPPYESFNTLFKKAQELHLLRTFMTKEQLEILDKMGFPWDGKSKQILRWFFNYYELKNFYVKNGHSRVPFTYPDNPLLGTWVSRQRKRKDKLSDKKIALLNKVNFCWPENLERKTWEQMYHKLKGFFKKHGNTQVLSHFPGDPSLSAWVSRQRRRKNQLSAEKKALLNNLNFPWAEDLEKTKWERKFQRLESYFQQNGHSQVPSDYHDRTLANWVLYLRKNKERLKPEQIEKLDDLGFVWDMQRYKKTHWEYMYNQLLLFKQKHGHTKIPVRHRNKKLATWVRAQRQRKHKLTPDKLKKLMGVGFVFSEDIKADRKKRWLANYQRLRKFYETHGHINVQDVSLIKWLYKQRTRKQLDEKENQLLIEIGAI